MSFHSLTLSATDCLWFLSLSSCPCTAHLDPLLQCHSWCTASWEGACFAPSWETSCWWSPRPLTTGCSTVCRAASPTRDCGGTACPASATCKPTASVGAMRLYMHSSLKGWGGVGVGSGVGWGLKLLMWKEQQSTAIKLISSQYFYQCITAQNKAFTFSSHPLILYLCIDHSAPIYLPSYLQSPCFFYRWTSKLYKGLTLWKVSKFVICGTLLWHYMLT